MKTDKEIQDAGFTTSGATRYKAATTAYCDELFTKAVALGDRDKAADTPREVTHEHVRDAATSLALRGMERQDSINVWFQIGEYLCAVAAGVGGGKLETAWGVALFGISLTIGVIFFVVRTFRSRGK